MNNISIKRMKTPYNYEEDYLIIDGVPLPILFDECARNSIDKNYNNKESAFGLSCAWWKNLHNPYDAQFIEKLLQMNSLTSLPILICPDDFDLSCIVLTAQVHKDNHFVYWDKLGYVTNENWDNDQFCRSGFFSFETYTDEDWEKYGNNIATETYGSNAWNEWISEHWEEESLRRHMNYTLPYYNDNTIWLGNVNWKFIQYDYERCISHYRDNNTK